MTISQAHSNRRLHNWLFYNIGDEWLNRFNDHYRGNLYDLGCGEMPFKEWLLNYADTYTGVDWSSTLHELKADILADLNEPLPIENEVADTVISLSVMEHLREGRLLTTGVTESELARAFYQQQGLDMAKVRLEGGSRSTRENAQQVAKLLGDRCKETWLLVTSAWHMSRSMAEFEAVGCKVTPFPVDFRTGVSTPLTEYSLAHSLLRWQTALHEWLGLLVYGVTR